MKQLKLSLTIWLLAVAINTITGTIWLTGSMQERDIPLLLFFGTVYGAIVSSPAIPFMFVVMNECTNRKKNAVALFRITMMAALVIGVLSWGLFAIFLSGAFRPELQFLPLAVFSGVAATAAHYKPISKMAVYEEEHAFENL